MRKLGEILLERGYASVGELHTALEASHRHRGRLGTQLLRLGFVTEKQLLEALAEQTGCPPLPREVLRATPVEVRRLLSPEDARRLHAVPFAIHHQRLQVAMNNPRDRSAIEEIQNLTGMVVETYVATEASVNAAIQAMAGELRQKKEESEGSGEEAGGIPSNEEWKGLWTGKMPSGAQLLRPLEELSGSLPGSVRYASYPSLAPMIDPLTAAGPGYLDEEDFERALLEAGERDEIGRALLGFAARYLTRLCLFSIYREKVHGWMVHGMGPVLEDVQCFSMDHGLPSIFSVLFKTAAHHIGPLPPGENNRNIGLCLGETMPQDVVVIPVQVKGRVVAFLLGDIPGQSTVSVPVKDLEAAATATGIALEMTILKKKISKSLAR